MKKYMWLSVIISLMPLPSFANEPSIVINEIAWMGTIASANAEWIELYNPTEEEITITDWKLAAADGYPAITLTGTIAAKSYFIVERTSDATLPEIAADQIYTGSLSNTGEHLQLKNTAGTIIDSVDASAGWPGGDNTTKQTLERTESNTWQTSAQVGGTPRAASSMVNIPPAEEEEQEEENPNDEPEPPTNEQTDTQEEVNNDTAIPTATETAKKGDVVLNEILPWPNAVGEEFIELKNVSTKQIDITSWKLKTGVGQEFTIPSITLLPNSLVVFTRAQTNLALNNTKEKITLSAKNRSIIDTRSYDKATMGNSYQRTITADFTWGVSSPSQDNTIILPVLPTAVVYAPKTALAGELIDFDATDSFDPLGRALLFSWDFGDGRRATGTTTRQLYAQAGKYEVSVTVMANVEASATMRFKISVTNPSAPKASTTATSSESITPVATSTPTIMSSTLPFVWISEFLPNPEGTDSELEFIELYNDEARPIDLAGFMLDDAEGGSKPFKFPEGSIIPAKGYKAFFAPQTKLNLNNSNDAVRLLSPAGELMDIAEYEKTAEGSSFVRDEQFTWQESETPSPDEINVLAITEIEAEEETTSSTSSGKVLGATTAATPSLPISKKWRYAIAALSGGVAILVIGGYQTYVFLKNRKN